MILILVRLLLTVNVGVVHGCKTPLRPTPPSTLPPNLTPNNLPFTPITFVPQDYLKLATAGAACNAIVRFALHPIDCVKTTVQAEMGRDSAVDEDDDAEGGGDGWIATVKGIVKNGGVGELTRGIDVSTVSACPARPPALLACMPLLRVVRFLFDAGGLPTCLPRLNIDLTRKQS